MSGKGACRQQSRAVEGQRHGGPEVCVRWMVSDGDGVSAEVCESSQASEQHVVRHWRGGVLQHGEGVEREELMEMVK